MVRTLVSRVRPAPLQSVLIKTLRLNAPKIVRAEGMQLLVDPSSVIGSQIEQGAFEPTLTAVVKRYLRPGATFVDVGANIGYFTVLGAHQVGPTGTVVAVEPQTRLQHVLARNLQMNECYNVRVVQAVISERTGEAFLHLNSAQNSGSSSLHRSTRYWLPTEKVRSWTLADFLQKAVPGNVDFMKIDIEGAEYELIMSSQDTLRRGVIRSIFVDFHTQILARRGLSPEAPHEVLLASGYVQNHETGVYEFARA